MTFVWIWKRKINAIPALRHAMRAGVPANISRKWKNREYDTVLLAEPIKIGTTPYLRSVRVETTQDYANLELHEVFVIKETTREPFTNETIRNNEATRGSTGGFTKSMLQNIANRKFKMLEDKVDRKFSLKDDYDENDPYDREMRINGLRNEIEALKERTCQDYL